MKKTSISIALSILLGFEFVCAKELKSARATTAPVANGQIIQVQGDVRLNRSQGNAFRPTAGTRVYPGDKLWVAGGKAIVQCADLSVQSVEAARRQVIPCPTATNSIQCTPGLYKCPHRGDGIAWLENIPYIITPRRTALLDDKPTLRWNAVPEATSYTVSVEGEGVDWTTQTNQTEIIYPGKSPLQPGESYLLTVMADTGASSLDGAVIPGGMSFTLLSKSQAQHVRTEAEKIAQQDWTESAKAIALANLYIENGLIADAIATLETLVASGTETAPIYRTLGDLYFNYLALVPQAGTYYTKAVELADPNDVEEQKAAQEGLAKVRQSLGEIL
jgi:hypothetical protein